MILSSGMEAISFQKNPLFHKQLVVEFSRLMELAKANGEERLTDEMISSSQLAAITFNNTGIKVTPAVDRRHRGNAYIIIPSLNSYHVFHNAITRAHMGFGEAFQQFSRVNNVLVGMIDLGKSTVTGIFSQINHHVALSYDLLTDYEITPGEAAAIYMHEVGHAFTFFEMLHYTATTNLVLTAGVESVIKAETSRKYAVLSDIENSLGIKIDNKDELIAHDKYENYAITILSRYNREIASALGALSHDESMAEQMADMFAARHGAGLDLARGLARIRKYYLAQYNAKRFSRIRNMVLWTIFTAGLKIVSDVRSAIIILATGDFFGGEYDRSKDRFIRMRNEIVVGLKDEQIDPADRKALVSQISELDAIIAETTNESSFLEKLSLVVRASQRERYASKYLQKDLEALLNNPLYVSAAKLKTLQ